MAFFPFFKEIEGAKGLVVGGGRVALRKTEKLLPYGPRLLVIAPDVRPEFFDMGVKVIQRPFCEGDITEDLEFVIAACDQEKENKKVYLRCQEMGIPVNVADKPEFCTFLFPSLVKRGKLSVGISTSGASPSAAVWLRKEIENLLPDHMEQTLDWLCGKREEAKKEIPEAADRSAFLKEIFAQRMAGEESPGEVKKGSVSLVGAGCGKKDWITVEGLRLLQSCDAVVYDDLIDKALLDEAPLYAERIYVGKRSEKNSARQEDIQEILINLARRNKHVVRLKGGDPFVFGRGGEEIEALNQQQIPWKIVPGISSALAIPAEAGIPVTHRGVSRSIHIMTARTKEDMLRKDMEQFADLEGTLVILMGVQSLEAIVKILKEKGRDKNTPAAVISGGNAACPYRVSGTLDTIVEKAKKEKVTTPGIIVIGNAAAFDLYRDAHLPLSGIEVGLTGTGDFQEKIYEKLLPTGANAVSMMEGKCKALPACIPWEQVGDGAEKWIVFTSVQGIRHFFERRRKDRIDNRIFAFCKFAVIGPATQKELEKFGFTADLCPKVYTSFHLAGELCARIKGGEKVYLFCSKQGARLLESALAEQGVDCLRTDIYDTCLTCANEMEQKPDFILFGSAGGVRALQRSGYRLEKETEGICIGPVCADAYRECFGKEPICASESTVGGLITALLDTAGEGCARNKKDEEEDERI